MATTLLKDFARGVFGVAEITALGSHPDQRELLLSGMRSGDIPRYFTNPAINLNAIWQQVLSPTPKPDVFRIRRALIAYLKSNMPILLPVDAGRIAGVTSAQCPFTHSVVSIYETNHLRRRRWLSNPKEIRPRRHAVVLVGCNGNEFLFNDPGVLPFLRASTGQLMEAAPYTDDRMHELLVGRFLPITPDCVRMPLEQWFSHTTDSRIFETENRFPGLLSIARDIQRDDPRAGWPTFASPYDTGEFRLGRPRELLASLAFDTDSLTESAKSELQDKLQDSGWSSHWLWFQACTNRSVWIWDAEIEPTKPDEWEKVLVGIFQYTPQCQDHWVFCRPNVDPRPCLGQIDGGRSDGQSAESILPERCKLSLISSFSANGITDALANWPSTKLRNCELYAFMQNDSERILPLSPLQWLKLNLLWSIRYYLPVCSRNFARSLIPFWFYRSGGPLRFNYGWRRTLGVVPPIATALERLSVGKSAKKASERISKIFQGTGIDIVAIASFLPEISCEGELGEKAECAIHFLIELSKYLKQRGHPVKAIELVGGSLISGIWEALEDSEGHDKKTYVANRTDSGAAVKRLCDRLERLGHEAEAVPVALALELEPGPLYCFGGPVALSRFCSNRQLSGPVGLNLDVAHWAFLSKIDPAELTPQDILRIRHAHISDSSNGHFSDTLPNTCHQSYE
jgi:sugar phosphate isomerase/epimerase